MAITKMPDELQKLANQPKPASEKKIQEFINKGGKPTEDRGGEMPKDNVIKSIKLNMTGEEMNAIKELRNKRPVKRGRKITISVHDWVIEAVREKIQRDQKKHGLTLL